MVDSKAIQYLFSTLFAGAFCVALLGLLKEWGDKTALVSIALATIGALFLTVLLPNLSNLKIGPTGIEASLLQKIEQKVDNQEKALAKQQKIVNELVIFSLATQPYSILWHLKSEPEYIYRDNENMRRWMNVLLDNGFIEPKAPDGWLQFDSRLEGKNVAELAKPTPAGEFLISLRGGP